MKSRNIEAMNFYFKRIKGSIYDQVLEKYKKEKHKPEKKRKLITFVSDGFDNYKNGTFRHFWNVCKIVFGVQIACKRYGLKHNNNPIERYNQDLDERYTITRHWGSFLNAKDTLKMRQIMHNFVNPHQQILGKTPAEAAGIKYKLGQNKLLELIMLTAKLKNFGDDVN